MILITTSLEWKVIMAYNTISQACYVVVLYTSTKLFFSVRSKWIYILQLLSTKRILVLTLALPLAGCFVVYLDEHFWHGYVAIMISETCEPFSQDVTESRDVDLAFLTTLVSIGLLLVKARECIYISTPDIQKVKRHTNSTPTKIYHHANDCSGRCALIYFYHDDY